MVVGKVLFPTGGLFIPGEPSITKVRSTGGGGQGDNSPSPNTLTN